MALCFRFWTPASCRFLRIWARLGKPGRAALEELQGMRSSQSLTHLGRSARTLGPSGPGPGVRGACSTTLLPPLAPGPKKKKKASSWGVRLGGCLGVPAEIWVLYLLFHIGSWKGKPIPAQHCCLTWLIRSYNPAVEILGLTQNNRDQEYCG